MIKPLKMQTERQTNKTNTPVFFKYPKKRSK